MLGEEEEKEKKEGNVPVYWHFNTSQFSAENLRDAVSRKFINAEISLTF